MLFRPVGHKALLSLLPPFSQTCIPLRVYPFVYALIRTGRVRMTHHNTQVAGRVVEEGILGSFLQQHGSLWHCGWDQLSVPLAPGASTISIQIDYAQHVPPHLALYNPVFTCETSSVSLSGPFHHLFHSCEPPLLKNNGPTQHRFIASPFSYRHSFCGRCTGGQSRHSQPVPLHYFLGGRL